MQKMEWAELRFTGTDLGTSYVQTPLRWSPFSLSSESGTSGSLWTRAWALEPDSCCYLIPGIPKATVCFVF